MDVGERIKRRREELKLTVDELAKKIGKNRATIYRYEGGEIENMSYKSIDGLSKALKVSPAYLMGWDDEPPAKPTSDYPYFPIGISAGLPIDVEPIVNGETITVPDEVLGKYAGSKDIYFTKVNGESMNKLFPHDSLIAVKQVEPHELKNGDIVVYSNGYDYSVKRFYDIGNKLIFKPESTDPSFTDHIIEKTSEDLRLHGKVVTYIVNVE